MRKIKKISAQSVEKKETESVSRRTEKASTRGDFLEIGVTIHNRQRLPQREQSSPASEWNVSQDCRTSHWHWLHAAKKKRDRERRREEGRRKNMSGKQIITSAVGKYVAATYQHNQQQIPGHAWVQSVSQSGRSGRQAGTGDKALKYFRKRDSASPLAAVPFVR